MAQQSIMALHRTEQFQVPDLHDMHQNCVYYRSDTYQKSGLRSVKDGLRCAQELILRVTLSLHMLAVALGPADRLDGRTLCVELLMTEWHRAFSLSIPIPIATPTPIALRRCLDSVVVGYS
jgi:hypothetical protein